MGSESGSSAFCTIDVSTRACLCRYGIAHADLERGVPDWLLDELAGLRECCELTVVFPHWGPNMSSAPALSHRQAAAALQHAAANLVAGHSAHAFHGIEWKKGESVLIEIWHALG